MVSSLDMTTSSPVEETGTPTPTTEKTMDRGGILLNTRTRSNSLPAIETNHVPISDSLSLPVSAVDSLQSSPGTSTSSLKLNVKFAPLPELPVRRRKSTTPLGVASRGQMMRRRRALAEGESSPMWTQEEGVPMDNIKSPADEMEDPLVTFGRKIKGAWRKVSKGKEKERGEAPIVVAGETRIALATIEPNEEEGRVWEEEVGDRFNSPK